MLRRPASIKSLRHARQSNGTVYAVDIEPEMLEATITAAGKVGVANVKLVERDFIADGTGLSTGSWTYSMVFNLLHIEALAARNGRHHGRPVPSNPVSIANRVNSARSLRPSFAMSRAR